MNALEDIIYNFPEYKLLSKLGTVHLELNPMKNCERIELNAKCVINHKPPHTGYILCVRHYIHQQLLIKAQNTNMITDIVSNLLNLLIKEALDHPHFKNQVANIEWDHYLETGSLNTPIKKIIEELCSRNYTLNTI